MVEKRHPSPAILIKFALLFLIVGVVIAAPMSFKHHRDLYDLNAVSNTHAIALPYIPKQGVTSAQALMDDIGFEQVLNVQRLMRETDSIYVYTGRKGSSPDFPLEAGEGYFVRVNTAVTYPVVGSHDPSVSIDLLGAGPPESNSGANFIALPYHSAAELASDLMNDIGFAYVAWVAWFDPRTDSLNLYTGRKGSAPDFYLHPGAAYWVKMNATVENFVPTHY